MTAITPDTGGTIVVSDANGVDRVFLGDLGNGDFGLKVIAEDGDSVLIDGSTDIFKVVERGSISAPFGAAPSTATVTTNVTTAVQLSVHLIVAPDDTPGAARYPGGTYRNVDAGGHVAYEAVGSYTHSGSTLTVSLAARSILSNPGTTAILSYYVLLPIAF